MREANGSVSEQSARTSLKRGASPSRFAVLEMGSHNKLAAKERAAGMERSPDHRDTKAATHAALWVTAALGARARVSKRMKAAASALQRPPTSRVGALFCPACFSQRCSSGAAFPALVRTGRSKRRDRSVNGKLRASRQRQAVGDHLDAALIMSVCLDARTRTCVATAAPASRQTRAAARVCRCVLL